MNTNKHKSPEHRQFPRSLELVNRCMRVLSLCKHVNEHGIDDTVVLCQLLRELTENTCGRKLLWRTTTYESHLAYLAERSGNLLLLVPRAPMELPRLLLHKQGTDSEDIEDLVPLPVPTHVARTVEKLYTAVRDSVLRHRNNSIDTLALFLAPEPPTQRQH